MPHRAAMTSRAGILNPRSRRPRRERLRRPEPRHPSQTSNPSNPGFVLRPATGAGRCRTLNMKKRNQKSPKASVPPPHQFSVSARSAPHFLESSHFDRSKETRHEWATRIVLQIKEGILRQIAAQSTPRPPETGGPPQQPVAGDIHPATVPKTPDINKTQ